MFGNFRRARTWPFFLTALLLVCQDVWAGEIFHSSDSRRWVEIDRGARGMSAVLHHGGTPILIFTDLPLPGNPAVVWPDAGTARISIPCGIECSATFFASVRGSSGPFPNVMSTYPKYRTFSYWLKDNIVISTMDPPVRTVGRLPLPDWCPGLQCHFEEFFDGKTYGIRDGKRKASISVNSSGQ